MQNEIIKPKNPKDLVKINIITIYLSKKVKLKIANICLVSWWDECFNKIC